MSGLISKLLMPKRKRAFTFALDAFPGRQQNEPVDDLVGPPLLSELGVFILRESGGRDNRTLTLDTDNDVAPEQIEEVFRRCRVTARLLDREEN